MTKTKITEDSVEELERQQNIISEQIRQKKRTDAEVNLQLAVSKKEYPDNLKETMQACYNFIATHRKMPKTPLPVTGAY